MPQTGVSVRVLAVLIEGRWWCHSARKPSDWSIRAGPKKLKKGKKSKKEKGKKATQKPEKKKQANKNNKKVRNR